MSVLDAESAITKLEGQVPFQTDRTVDATARQVYVANVVADKDSVARFLGVSGKRQDISNLAIVTVREGIGS